MIDSNLFLTMEWSGHGFDIDNSVDEYKIRDIISTNLWGDLPLRLFDLTWDTSYYLSSYCWSKVGAEWGIPVHKLLCHQPAHACLKDRQICL